MASPIKTETGKVIGSYEGRSIIHLEESNTWLFIEMMCGSDLEPEMELRGFQPGNDYYQLEYSPDLCFNPWIGVIVEGDEAEVRERMAILKQQTSNPFLFF